AVRARLVTSRRAAHGQPQHTSGAQLVFVFPQCRNDIVAFHGWTPGAAGSTSFTSTSPTATPRLSRFDLISSPSINSRAFALLGWLGDVGFRRFLFRGAHRVEALLQCVHQVDYSGWRLD